MQVISEIFLAIHIGGIWVSVILVLGVMAVILILDKAFVFWRYARLPHQIVTLIETYGFDWAELDRHLKALKPGNYFDRFLQVILVNRSKPGWWVESRAADEASLIEKTMGRGLWMLETVVTAAPLLGLLGTISGMIGSFKLFGNAGLVDPGAVTGGVAEALISTAFGIFVALVSLFAFNFYARRQSQVLDEMERLGTRMIDHIRLDEQGHSREAA